METTWFNAALAIGGGTVLFMGLVAGWVKNRFWVSEPLACVAVGVVIQFALPGGDWFELQETGDRQFLDSVFRVTLAISIIGATMRLPRRWLRENGRDLALVLSVGLLAIWAVGTALAWSLLALPLLTALVLGAVLAPTDPVVADSIITGRIADRCVPARVRQLISAEAGANDGLAFMLVMLPVLLLEQATTPALREWFLLVVLWEIVAGALAGAAIGWLAGHLLRWAHRREESEHVSMLSATIALAVTVLAVVALAHADGLLAVFTAGLAFNNFVHELEDHRFGHVEEGIARFTDLPAFVLLGTILPFELWDELGWAGLGFAAAVLALRRVPVWLALWPLTRSLHGPREALFAGWFGPVGIAALFLANLVQSHGVDETVWAATSLVVTVSVVLHGVTATPLTRLLGGRSAISEGNGR